MASRCANIANQQFRGSSSNSSYTGESGTKETDANVCPPEWPRVSLLWAKVVWGGVIRLLSEISIKIHFFVK